MIDTMNDCMVGSRGGMVVIQIPKPEYTREEALRLAAWLKIVADGLPAKPDDPSFEQIVEAIEAS